MSAPQQPTIVTPENSSVANIVFKIQQTVFPRRIRVKDIFRDYDPLRSMRVTKPQFRRAMSSLNIKNFDGDISVDGGYNVAKTTSRSLRWRLS